jgi:hypothetical protein
MTTAAFTLPPGLAEENRDEVVRVLGEWAADERLEGLLLLGRTGGLRYHAPEADVVIVTTGSGAADFAFSAVCGRTWLRVRVFSLKGLLAELTDGPATPFKLALKDAFIALDRLGRLTDALRALEPMLQQDLPRAKMTAAARLAAALRDAGMAVTEACPTDAAEALVRACARIAELDYLNEDMRPPFVCPLAGDRAEGARRLFASVRRAGGDVGKLARVVAEASALYKSLLPAAAAPVFDFLIRRGGSAAVASAVEALGLRAVADIDLVLAALEAYGLIKVGREERPVPGLPGLTRSEPVLTLP